MKGLSSGRHAQLQLQLSSPNPHTCGLLDCDHPLDHHHGDSRPPSYLLSPTESCPLDGHRRCSPRSSIHSDCMMMPVSMSATDHSISSSTFPRMHYGSTTRDGTSNNRDCRDETGSTHGGSGKMNRIPANLLDQFEKQMPLHRDGFHTLQYQRTSTTTTSEQRNESPGRIRHLVHSVQKLFTKSHSLEGSSKMNGTKSDSHRDGSHHHHHHHHKHSKRSKSKDRKSEGSVKQRSGGWWSSDDNLDSDSTYRTPSIMSRHHMDHITHCYPDSHGHLVGDMSLKMSKSNNDVKCSACESINMAPEGKFMKRSSWSTLTVSQAKEAYRKSSLNLEKPMDLKPNVRACHYLQVPQDEWAGYPGGGKDDEIPCRRMRSSSYVKAMGDEESGESDSSPKMSPQKSVRPDALVKALVRPRDLLDSQSSYRLDKINSDMRNYITNFAADLSQNYHHLQTRDMHPSIGLDPSTNYNSPKFRSRNQSYMRAVSTLSQASCVSQVSQVSETEVNGQFESVCESVFSEVEAQAMEALDLPGCFRTRSHSYLRAIQAGYSQDDDCIPPITSTLTSTIRSTTDRNYMQEESCLPDRPSVHEKLPDTTPLAHDDIGCPIRRDIPSRVYPPDTMGATAKPVSGPPVSPSLFRSPRSNSPERSPKAIQASIKESATLAAAISMQWKEEVSAMRRELADLRQDLCKELRAFNNNFNMFTQHYNTWSPQVSHMTVRVGPGLGGGLVGEHGLESSTKATTGIESAEKSKPSKIDRATLGAKEKKPEVSKVSVGTQARSKILVRQSTADAAVNCPDEKDEKKSGRKGLPKQLSMDPSILASPQSMFVESAIPLDPILPTTVRTFKPKKVEMTIKPAKARGEAVTSILDGEVDHSSQESTLHESTTQSTTLTGKLENEDAVTPKPDLSDDTASDESKETIVLLPYAVPMVTVSPPDDNEVVSDSESIDPMIVDHPDPVSATQSEVYEPETCDSPPPPYPGIPEVTVAESKDGIFITCPSIIVSEHFEPGLPESPTDNNPGSTSLSNIPEVIISSPPTSEPTSEPTSRTSSPQATFEEDPKDSEWPPLPEPVATAPIYQSDLVHFDLVMLTSLDQDDLDSVFMDPEPEPLDLSDSLSNCEEPPFYQTDYPTSPLPTVDAESLCPQSELPYLDPSMDYNLDDMPQHFQVQLPLVTVTISPPSSVSRESSMDFGTPDPPSSPDLVAESDDMFGKSQESLSISQESGSVLEEETASNPERSVDDFLWYRCHRGTHNDPVRRSASVELWSAITYTPSYKKDPPPVPPRTTSKPLISITAQSSTESTQDAYHEGRHRTSMWTPDGLTLGLSPGRPLYNSTDSLDSTKAVTLAMEAAKAMAGKRHPSTDSHSSVLTCDKAILVSKAEEYLKTPRSSIGIQVEAATDSESESKGLREYHSVGTQVEDDKKSQGRFKRSNSVTTAVQADLEVEGFPIMEDKGLQFGGGFQRHSEPSTPTQYGAVRTVRTQGLFSYRDDYRTPTEPSSPRESSSEATWQLEPPSPRDSTASPVESGRVSPSLRRDGTWFMQLLHNETKRMEGWCKEMEAEAEENDLTEETLGKIRSAVGSAQLLMSQKFQQFYWLCQQNLDPSAMPRPTSQDLAGFWDLLQLSIDDVTMKFDQLQEIKNNNWRPLDSPEKKLPASVPKKMVRQRSGIVREKSLDLPDRHRQEARRRLMAAKRAASFRQNSASERADSIEIYIPEAQTRL